MADFEMPSLGADMESGLLVEWQVAPGDKVVRGQVVAVVETDKGAIDVEIFEDGIIEELLVEPETEVPVGTVLARLRVEGEAPAAPPAPSDSPPTLPSPAANTNIVTPPPAVEHARRVSPRARKLAAELEVSLEGLQGTGPGGSVTGEDVRAAVESSPSRPSPAEGMRAAIAAAMSRSKREIPHYYLAHTIDLEPALGWLEAQNAERPITERVLPIALLVRAVALALQEFPELCGWWREGAFVPAPGINIGLAVSLREGGLVNPAIIDADQGSLHELFEKIRDVTGRARKGRLRGSEFSGSAITLTNLGDQGVESVFGVIHPPQVAIVGLGQIAMRPWVVDGSVQARRVVTISLSADHRASDGHRGGRFLRLVEQHLEKPQFR